LTLDPGVVERAVEAAEGLDRPVERGAHVAIARHVARDEQRACAGGLDQARRLAAAFGIEVRDGDARALAGERERGGPADSRGGTGVYWFGVNETALVEGYGS
jgi:hypothetical protein